MKSEVPIRRSLLRTFPYYGGDECLLNGQIQCALPGNHHNMPKNMESLSGGGRAGRDGEPAECILLYGGQDVHYQSVFADHNQGK